MQLVWLNWLSQIARSAQSHSLLPVGLKGLTADNQHRNRLELLVLL